MALTDDTLAEERKSITRSIGERIAAYRKIVRMDQKELARRLGVKPSTMNRWETGYTPISVYDLMRVAQVLKKPVSWFLGEPPNEDEPVHRLEQSYKRLTPGHQSVLLILLRELLRLQEAVEVEPDRT